MGFTKQRESGRGKKALTGLGIGAAVMYFFDPRLGRTRRAQLVQRIGGIFRTTGRKAERSGRYVGAQTEGFKARIEHAGQDRAPETDEVLVAKVESEVLNRHSYPGKINVDAVDGIVELRGQLDKQRDIDKLEQEVRKVTGVIDVRNFVHLPGEDAPNKESALQSSSRS